MWRDVFSPRTGNFIWMAWRFSADFCGSLLWVEHRFSGAYISRSAPGFSR
jgi:hypothetical protein